MHYKQNNKETKSYVQGLRPFGNTLPRGLKGILKKNGYNYSEIISKWDMLVGKEISAYSYPKSIKMNKGDSNGTLILAIKRGNEINIEYSKEEIMNKVNSYFGYKLISEIKLQSFNIITKNIKTKNNSKKYLKKFEEKINKIKSEKIKKSLSQLFKAMEK
tara:strand:- start:859 stop:1338 length:480 start_codon:yes stop_codon:yes gene_type:complete